MYVFRIKVSVCVLIRSGQTQTVEPISEADQRTVVQNYTVVSCVGESYLIITWVSVLIVICKI